MPLFLKKKNFIILFSLLGLQFILLSLQLPRGETQSFMERCIFGLVANVQSGVTFVLQGVSDLWHDYISLRQAHQENEKLKKENITLIQQNLLLKELLARQEKSASAEKILQNLNKEIVIAQVIGLDPANFFRTMVINRGKAQGLQPNMIVLNAQGQLVGRIINPVSWQAATVQLVTDSNFAASVHTEQKNLVGILAGDGHGRCFLKYILETEKNIEVGEEILTTGYDGIFFPGIPVGRISVIYSGQSLFKRILVEPYFNFRHLDVVAVVKTTTREIF
ncbi:rod shape-determining protein MreC [Candidatus Aminicenantes bacterium AC-334-K16]|jgi:rod shape-determining protein MreC|nr:rod shape-determining protein MreC [Candidatus Aminicenantes bacterium AC-334-K16]